MSKLTVGAAFICLLAPVAWAAGPASTGGPINQLDFYVGNWSEEGESRADASQPFSKLSGSESCEWFAGGPSVVCRETTTDRVGKAEGIYILTYDSARKVYTVYGTDNGGTIYSGTGTVENGKWLWNAQAAADGSVTQMRYHFAAIDTASRSMDVEVVGADGSWTKIVSVVYRRVK